MCLIAFAYKQTPDYPLILLANRDEFFQRQTRPLHWWDDRPILGGKDLEAGGSWLALNRTGRLAALTNFREPAPDHPVPSRGELVSGFLESGLGCEDYIQSQQATLYRGYNLLCGDGDALYYTSNRGTTQPLEPGIYGLSNGLLDSDWPKVTRLKSLFEEALNAYPASESAPFFQLMLDRHFPPDDALPDTGVGLEREKILSPIFIRDEGYGTRSSTFLTLNANGEAQIAERTYDTKTLEFDEASFSFQTEPAYAVE